MNTIYIRHPQPYSPTPSVDFGLPSPISHHHHHLPRPSGSPNSTHLASTHEHHHRRDSVGGQLESDQELDPDKEQELVGELSVFGDFCLMCGQMIDGVTFQGSAYCSEECEYHQLILSSDSDWCNLSLEGYQLPNFGTSTAVSSAKSTPLNSPRLPSCDRLAILSSGPPSFESFLPLDLGERLLGAKAVAQQYLDHRPKSIEDDAEENDREAGYRRLSSPSIPLLTHNPDLRSSVDHCPLNLATTTKHDPSPSISPIIHPHLKSRPALAQLTDLNQLSGLSELLEPDHRFPGRGRPVFQRSSATIDPIDARLSPITNSPQRPHDRTQMIKAHRRVSDPIYHRSERPPHDLIYKPTYHSSFSLTSLSSLSPSALDCSSHHHSRLSHQSNC